MGNRRTIFEYMEPAVQNTELNQNEVPAEIIPQLTQDEIREARI